MTSTKNEIHVASKLTPRTIKYMVSDDSVEPVIEDSIIVGLRYISDDVIFHVGDNFSISERKQYKVNHIKKVSSKNNLSIYYLSCAPTNKSNIFLLPMFGGNRKLFFYDNLLVNCFINDENYTDKLILLYRFSGSLEFLKFEQTMKKFRSFVEAYDPDKTHVAFVFNIPVKHEKIFNLFKEGKYSKFPEEYKQKILNFHDFDISGQTSQILYKSEERRLLLEQELEVKISKKSELYDVPKIEDETLTEKYFIK